MCNTLHTHIYIYAKAYNGRTHIVHHSAVPQWRCLYSWWRVLVRWDRERNARLLAGSWLTSSAVSLQEALMGGRRSILQLGATADAQISSLSLSHSILCSCGWRRIVAAAAAVRRQRSLAELRKREEERERFMARGDRLRGVIASSAKDEALW